MTPVLFLGAAIAGAAIARAVTLFSSESEPKTDKKKSEQEQQAASPQSYVVTPVPNGPARVETLSAVEAVRKFIV